MLVIPAALQAQYIDFLKNRMVPSNAHSSYLKWLRFYLDFCTKYHFSPVRRESLVQFLRKLHEKRQTKAQQEQASQAIMLYYELVHPKGYRNDNPSPNTVNPPADTPNGSSHRPVLSTHGAKTSQAAKPRHAAARGSSPLTASSVHEAYAVERTPSPRQADPETLPRTASSANSLSMSTAVSWKAEYTGLAHEIQVRHYSPKTLSTYTQWVRQFQTFTRSKAPGTLSSSDVKEFLTFLAVTRKVSASTQNQAFNALLFFYRNFLNKEFGKLEGVVRAKRKPYILVVLSREEIQAVLTHLAPPYDLVVKLLYGCGLRLFDCLHPQVQAVNFDAGILTVHDGKGQKDRTVPLPEKIIPELRAHLESLKMLHQRDLDRNHAGVFLVNALERK